MGHDERRSQRLVFQLGAALAVTALAPVSELFPANAAPIERLSALREAARTGCPRPRRKLQHRSSRACADFR